MPNVHDGHRQRLKERFLRDGLDGFEPHNVLELLLFFAVPRQDTNELAHRLLERFGSLSAVFDADPEELCGVPGIGRGAMTLLKLIPDLARRYETARAGNELVLKSVDEIAALIRPQFIGRTKERVYLLCLDNGGHAVHGGFISEGGVNSAPIDTRAVLEMAIKHRAASVVLAHNHPGGMAVPSHSDLLATEAVRMALEGAKIRLLDHLIFDDKDCVSLRDSGALSFKR